MLITLAFFWFIVCKVFIQTFEIFNNSQNQKDMPYFPGSYNTQSILMVNPS